MKDEKENEEKTEGKGLGTKMTDKSMAALCNTVTFILILVAIAFAIGTIIAFCS